jgi:hypothetical protein
LVEEGENMSILNTPQELIDALSIVAGAENPIEEIEHRGYILGPEMARQLEAAKGGLRRRTPISHAVKVPPPGSVTFSAGKPTLAIPRDRDPGDYDVIVGVRTELANEAFAKLYESGTVPHVVALDQSLSSEDLASLATLFVVDREGGSLSRLLITSAPTMETISDGKDFVAVKIPFRLNWDRTTHFGGVIRRVNVTFATGTFSLIMGLKADVQPLPVATASMTIAVELLPRVDSPAQGPRFVLDPHSPVQRLGSQPPPDQIDLAASLIEDSLRKHYKNALKWTISPVFPLSIGSIEIQQLDVRSVGDALIAGLNLVGTPGG